MRNLLRVSELNQSVKNQESLHGKYEMLRGGYVEGLETVWEKFRDFVKECTNNVCGMRRVGGQRRTEREEVNLAVAEKRRAFGEWMQILYRDTYDRYRHRELLLTIAE